MPIKNSILRLWSHVNQSYKRQFLWLLLLTVSASLAELVSLGIVVPFLSALSNPENLLNNHTFHAVASLLEIDSPNQIVLWLTILFCVTAILSGLLRWMVMFVTTRLSFAVGSDLSVVIYRKTLYQDYSVHLSRNSSEIIDGISTKVNTVIYGIILPLLTLINSIILLLGIFAILIYINPVASIASIFIFGVAYICIVIFTRARKIFNSLIISKQSTQVIKCLQEGLGGIRDVILDGTQHIFCDNYKQSDKKLRRAQENNQVLSLSPRYLIESLGMVLIAVVALYIFDQGDGSENAIPLLGLFALSAQRILPIMQQAYASWSSIQGSYASLQDVLNLLDQPFLPNQKDLTEPILFKSAIKLVDVNFSYKSSNQNILQNLNLNINKGDRIGIVGLTGSGKSTLIDIIMGLLTPISGQLLVDDTAVKKHNVKGWHVHIAHVPQSIYISDASIAENIAFGLDKKDINFDRVREAAKKAQLDSVIANLPGEYDTLVGERGIRLSGGQRQRIGIARALYKKADVFIFDEATSALDNRTEESIIQSIESLGEEITVIMIAHRLTTLRICRKIIEIADGQIINVGNYEQIINRNV